MLIACKYCGDVEPVLEVTSIHIKASCPKCGKFIKFVPRSLVEDTVILEQVNKTKPSDFTFHFGKYQNMKLSEIEDRNYLGWIVDKFNFKQWQRELILNKLKIAQSCEENPTDFVLFWGRYKGQKLSEVTDLRYLKALRDIFHQEWQTKLIEQQIEKNMGQTNE